jgi:ribosomal protein S18
VEACADFRNAQFLTNFVSEAGKLVPRRRTRLQQKLHRHLCRQVRPALRAALWACGWATPRHCLLLGFLMCAVVGMLWDSGA